MTDTQNVLVLPLPQALRVFEQVRMQDIRDIRSVDTDMLFVMRNGQQIVWQQGALTVLQKPDLLLVFKDGTLRAEQLFKQIETIEIIEPKAQEHLMLDVSHAVHQARTVVPVYEVGMEQKWVVL